MLGRVRTFLHAFVFAHTDAMTFNVFSRFGGVTILSTVVVFAASGAIVIHVDRSVK